MSAVRFQFNQAAERAIKSSPQVVALLRDIAAKITDTANQGRTPEDGGFVGGVDVNRSGARGYVVTLNQHGMHAEALDRRLTQALGAGRG